MSGIACLFTRTLRGWHRAAENIGRSISEQLIELFPESLPPRRRRRAAELAAPDSLKDLVELRALFVKCDSTPVFWGPIHGDLHAKNVLVRATDAIVIDFAKYREGPLVYDAACLEAGLLVEGFDHDKRDLPTWLQSVRHLYDQPVCNVHVRLHTKNPSSWFEESVRQIRLYARDAEFHEGQYAGALGLALLRKACKDVKVDEGRRAAAYVLAERVLVNAFASEKREFEYHI